MRINTAESVEEFFNNYIKHMGGKRYEDVVTDLAEGELNPDYIFPEEGFLIELKVFSEDRLANGSISGAAYQALAKSHSGLDIFENSSEVFVSSLPSDVQLAVHRKRMSNVRDRVRKSSDQLKAGRARFPNFRTIGIYFNAEDRSITPEIFLEAYLRERTPAWNRSGLDSVVFTSIGLPIEEFGNNEVVDGMWVADIKSGCAESSKFIDQLFERLKSYIDGDHTVTTVVDRAAIENFRYK